MRFVHYYPKAVSEHSGVTYSLWRWAEAVTRVSSWSAVVLHAGGPYAADYSNSTVQQEFLPHVGNSRPTYLPRGLGARLRHGDVLVLHDGWVNSNLVAARVARQRGIPYVVVPHGAYETDLLLTLKAYRLRAPLEAAMLRGAAAAHVFYESEKQLIRKFAPHQACFVLAHNGIEPVPVAWEGGAGFLSWYGRLDVHHKGLDLLVDAVGRLSASDRPHIRLHGYDYNGGLAQLRELIARHGVEDAITVGDRVDGDAKWDLIRTTDGYVHVSRYESASIALLEHMSAGVPMLLTRTTRMSVELEKEQLAAVTDLDPASIAEGLLALSRSRRDSQRLRRYTAENFAWDEVARRYLAQLEPMLAGRS